MVLGEAEPSDKSFERHARIFYYGQIYDNVDVYGDRKHPRRRTVFPPYELEEKYDTLPEEVDVEWMGERYTAELTFRYAGNGASVPAYQFWIED